ncbi:hypothetical protein UFOVP109_2 [uncultured Caudovirales phage]|uniref:Glycine-rich domain-containing protein n=1 Tax=uncultured Caudovirales phage TaxID=2100421 RepID=A0A6J5L3S5_9CAUD|nr:hypothetical protein UFOVP109_2 [uncultured Caudovirales phage]CAB5218969.1 hypothetical protein UFOVP224_15 [uncultured Caudovirales phage]
MNSLTDLNKKSTQLLPIVDTRDPAIVFTTPVVSEIPTNPGNVWTAYVPGTEFKTITNAQGGYIDWRVDGGVCLDTSQTVLTTGYALKFLTLDTGGVYDRVIFGNIKANAGGRVTYLSNVGTGTMYCQAIANTDGFYEYTVFGIKNLADWNAIKTPTINTVSQIRSANIITAYNQIALSNTVRVDANTQPRSNTALQGPTLVANFANATITGNTYVFTTTGNTTFTPTAQEKTQLCDIVVIGGGGGGSKKTTSGGFGGGGGAGEVRLYVGAALRDNTYTVRVGAGGGATGGNTYLRGNTTGTIVEAWGGLAATGQAGGNPIDGYPESSGFANTTQITGNTVARWWHWGAVGTDTYGGGGGGALGRGTVGSNYANAQGGAGLVRNLLQLSLLQRSGSAIHAAGGGATTNPATPTTTIPGAGGSGAGSTGNAKPGSSGLVLLRFY